MKGSLRRCGGNQDLFPVRLDRIRQMGMEIDQSREKCDITQFDRPSHVCIPGVVANGSDDLTFDQHGPRLMKVPESIDQSIGSHQHRPSLLG